MSPNSSIGDHIRTVTQLFDSLAAVGDSLDDKNRVMILMSGLPSKFDVLITALQSNKDVPSFEELVEKLNAEEYRQANRDSDANVALFTSQYNRVNITGILRSLSSIIFLRRKRILVMLPVFIVARVDI